MSARIFRTELLDEDAEADRNDRWILSYADFITLMFAFFVVMYSVSSINDGKFRVLSETFLEVFQNPEVAAAVEARIVERANQAINENEPDTAAATPEDIDALFDPTAIEAEALAEVLTELLAQPIAKSQMRIRTSEDWTELELSRSSDSLMPGVPIDPELAQQLSTVAAAIRAADAAVRVEVFSNAGDQNNAWRQTAIQAAQIAERLVAAGVDPAQISAAGLGAAHATAAADEASAAAHDHRVVIAIARDPSAATAAVSTTARDSRPETLEKPVLKRVTRLPPKRSITL